MGVAASCGDQTMTLYLLSKGADPEVQTLASNSCLTPSLQVYMPVYKHMGSALGQSGVTSQMLLCAKTLVWLSCCTSTTLRFRSQSSAHGSWKLLSALTIVA